MQNTFLMTRWLMVGLGATLTAGFGTVFSAETGTATNQVANLCATNSITLRGTTIMRWQDLTNSLDACYANQAATWSYYPAASNVSLANKEITNLAAMTLGGARRTNWPGQTITFLAQGASLDWLNQPAALTEFVGATIHRTKVDLAGYQQVRLTVVMTVTGAASAQIVAQYSTDESTWSCLDGNTGPSAAINTPVGLKSSSWVNLTGNAQQDVFLRLAGTNGNGAADPSFGVVTLQIK